MVVWKHRGGFEAPSLVDSTIRLVELTDQLHVHTHDVQWGMKRKDQKKDGAVRPEDVPGGACIDACMACERRAWAH